MRRQRERGQALIELALAAIFAAVGNRFKNEIQATFEFVIQMLQGARR
jgi:hypothetical protein